MKFLLAVEGVEKFVLYGVSLEFTKQIFLHNPEKYSQTTLIHSPPKRSKWIDYAKPLFTYFYLELK